LVFVKNQKREKATGQKKNKTHTHTHTGVSDLVHIRQKVAVGPSFQKINRQGAVEAVWQLACKVAQVRIAYMEQTLLDDVTCDM